MPDVSEFIRQYKDSAALQKAVKSGMYRAMSSMRAEARRRLRKEGATAKAVRNEFGMVRMEQTSWDVIVLRVKNFDLSASFFEPEIMRRGGVRIKGRLARSIKFKHAFMINGSPFIRNRANRELKKLQVPGDKEVNETSGTIEKLGMDFFGYIEPKAASAIFGSLRQSAKAFYRG